MVMFIVCGFDQVVKIVDFMYCQIFFVIVGYFGYCCLGVGLGGEEFMVVGNY